MSTSTGPRRRPSRLGTALVAAPVLVVLGLAVGALVPGIPRLSRIGADLTDYFAWLVVAAFACVVVAGIAWWRVRSPVRLLVAVLAVLALAGTAAVGGRQLAVARDNGVDVDVPQLFTLSAGDVAPDETVTYTRFEGQPIDLSLWRPNGGGPAPVVVMVHGGGWISGDRLQATTASHARWFADRGYLVASIDYALSRADRPLWDVQQQQVGCALAWVAANAGQYGGDPSRLALTGDSAGGNLALLASYRGNAGTLTSSCGGTVPRVDAVSTLYPSASPQGFYENPDPQLGPGARRMAGGYTGGSPREYPERYGAVTPANFLRPQAPPTLVVVGERDPFVPPQGAYDLAARATDAGITTRLIRIPTKDHILDAAPGGVWAQVWRQATLDWFAGHGAGI